MSLVNRLVLVLILILLVPVASAWTYPNNLFRVDQAIADGARPYQLNFNISNLVGTNNATHIFCNEFCDSSYDDLHITIANSTVVPFYIGRTYGDWTEVWVNLTVNGTMNVYFGEPQNTSLSNGSSTFILYTDTKTSNYVSSQYLNGSGGYVYLGNVSVPAATILDFGFGDSSTRNPSNSLSFETYTQAVYQYYISAYKAGAGTYTALSSPAYSSNTPYIYEIYWYNSSLARYVRDGTSLGTLSSQIPVTSNGMFNYFYGGAGTVNYQFVRRYVSSGPSFVSFGSSSSFLISDYENNFTSDQSSYFDLTESTMVNFNITASGENTTDYFAWFLNGDNQSTNWNNASIQISDNTVNNVSVIAYNTTNSYQQMKTWYVTLPLTLLTPANGSTLPGVFPPMTTSVYFSWASVGYPYYQLVVSKNSAFSLNVSDTYTTNTYKSISLEPDEYWWMVRSYNLGTGEYSSWSPIFNFTLTGNTSGTGTQIQGVVFEYGSDNSIIPVMGATVYLCITTDCEYMTTSSTGYYEFTNLTNATTYNMYAIKSGYDTAGTYPVTTGTGTITIFNIPIRRTVNPYIPTTFQARLRLMSSNGTGIRDAATILYYAGTPNVAKSGTTGVGGYIEFELDLNQGYDIVFSDLLGNEYYSEDNVFPKPGAVTVFIVGEETHVVTPEPVNNTVPANITGTWGIYDFTNASLQSTYEIGPKGQGLIMSIIALFMIPYGGIVAMIVIAFGFAYLGLLSYPFVMVSGIFCAAWYLIKKEFS